MALRATLTLWRVIKKNRDSYFNYATPKKVWLIYLEMAVNHNKLSTNKTKFYLYIYWDEKK
jgi:hypothetical protein